MKLITNLFSLIFLTTCLHLNAQQNDLSLIIGRDTVKTGDSICVPMTVVGFKQVTALLIALQFDPKVLQMTGLKNIKLPNAEDPNVYAFNNNTGRLVINWGTLDQCGVSIKDSTVIFEMCFVAVGPPGSSSKIIANGNGFPGGTNPEISRCKTPCPPCIWENIFPNATLYNGEVLILGSNSTQNLVEKRYVDLAPNPATDFLLIQRITNTTERYQWTLSDTNGQTLLQQWFSEASTKVNLPKLPFGMYYWQLRDEGQILMQTGRLVLQGP